ncbi:MAG: hypothetical protein JXR63_06955 [Spirochaetales bacterium]|nr:hypothetical protein [Spirochaetales bacterium]
MFFFTGYTVVSVAVFFGMMAALLLINEVTRRNMYAGIAFFIGLPVLLSIFWWPKSAADATWFAWVKTYSALAGVVGFMVFRYVKVLQNKKLMILFPSFILIVNILEAIVREFEVYGYDVAQMAEAGLQAGPWNLLNGIAGVLLVISMSGFLGVKIANTKTKDMIWADQLWFWIIAYDLWNIAFCYNTIAPRAMYTGVLLIVACTLADFFIKRGAWLQHRAYTLAMFGMFSLTFPGYEKLPAYSITSSGNTDAMLVLAILSIVFNVGVFGFAIFTAIKKRRNPLTKDLYTDLKIYKKIISKNNL